MMQLARSSYVDKIAWNLPCMCIVCGDWRGGGIAPDWPGGVFGGKASPGGPAPAGGCGSPTAVGGTWHGD